MITFVKETNEWVGVDELDIHRQKEASDEVWIFVK